MREGELLDFFGEAYLFAEFCTIQVLKRAAVENPRVFEVPEGNAGGVEILEGFG